MSPLGSLAPLIGSQPEQKLVAEAPTKLKRKRRKKTVRGALMISKQDYPMTERLWARKKQTPLKVLLFHSRLFSANELIEELTFEGAMKVKNLD